MKTELSSFCVSPEDVIHKSAMECAYDFYERHNIPRTTFKIISIRPYEVDDGVFFYEAEIEYDEQILTEEQLAWAGIGNR